MKNRIIAIDVLRGFALLGILLMNIVSFAMPGGAYSNPTVYGGNDIWNRLVFNLSHIFADQKMMALFSMLFGASVMLVTSKMEKQGKSPFWFHYIRNFWLLIIGLLHSVLLWEGDILVIYAVCSFMLYLLRKLPPTWQFGLGLFIFFVPSLLNFGISVTLPFLEPADWQALQASWQPGETAVSEELAFYRGGYMEQLAYRISADTSTESYTDGEALLDLSAIVEYASRAFGMMLIGMAFYTWGILSAKKSEGFYINMALTGFGFGLPIALISLFQYTAHNWGAYYSLFNGRIPNHVATTFIASGYIAVIMLWSRANIWQNLRERLAAVGRMALTNYIGQSIIGTFLFYGFGLGLFGFLNRVHLLLVVIFIWVLQLVFSSWWLERYQYGPLEWVWRILSHRRWQPLQKRVPALENVTT